MFASRRNSNTISLSTVASSGSTTNLLRHHNSPLSDPEKGPSVRLPRQPAFTNSNYPARNANAKTSHVEQSPYSIAMHSSSSQTSLPHSLASKFSFSPDPNLWGANLSPNVAEPDDHIHLPDARDGKYTMGDFLTQRSIANLGCMIVVFVGLITLFAGYPLISHFTSHQLTNMGGFNLGGTNASGLVPSMPVRLSLIDPDTPESALTVTSKVDGTTQFELVFSDEFNTDGRSFYPGDDPYWEAGNLYYWETNDLEWYDPKAITTQNGSLQITLSRTETHNLTMQGGMMSSWNKFCFTGGYIEVSAQLPGLPSTVGYWPAIWTMGNLGRAGYGASLDGMWPYTYDTCDVGTVANQSVNGIPPAALTSGNSNVDGTLSYLSGQRLSRCTCPGESHPGPVHASDGTYVGRSSPEIDIFEAQVTGNPLTGQLSQSAQFAPFDPGYVWNNQSGNLVITNPDITILNSYIGGTTQEAASGVTNANTECYENTGGCFDTYGYEYKPGLDDAYIAWISSGKMSWMLKQAGFDSNNVVEIGPRPIAEEPMYIIMNFASSQNFATFNPDDLPLPATMKVDYVRVYQEAGQPKNYGCDPTDFPTADYINTYIEAYTNPNLTSWVKDYGQEWPKNSFLKQCPSSTS